MMSVLEFESPGSTKAATITWKRWPAKSVNHFGRFGTWIVVSKEAWYYYPGLASSYILAQEVYFFRAT